MKHLADSRNGRNAADSENGRDSSDKEKRLPFPTASLLPTLLFLESLDDHIAAKLWQSVYK